MPRGENRPQNFSFGGGKRLCVEGVGPLAAALVGFVIMTFYEKMYGCFVFHPIPFKKTCSFIS